MKPLDDILRSRADGLDLERGDQLANIQTVLNELYPGKVRAKKLQDGVLVITTPSAIVANDVRLRQREVLEKVHDYGVDSVRIQIS